MKIGVVALITDPEAVKDVLSGKLDAFSLRWTTTDYLINKKTNQRIDTHIKIEELTITDNPANPEATFSVVTDQDIAKQYKLGEKVEVFDTIANVKSLYTDGLEYYADLEFEGEIVNLKTANKINVKNYMQDVIVNVKTLYKVNIIKS
jgi:hypothetical protein